MRFPSSKAITRKVGEMVLVKKPQQPNRKMNVGLFSEFMGSIRQMPIIKALQPQNNVPPTKDTIDNVGSSDTGKGTKLIPETKDFWLGDPL
jgi:hypothetical protein